MTQQRMVWHAATILLLGLGACTAATNGEVDGGHPDAATSQPPDSGTQQADSPDAGSPKTDASTDPGATTLAVTSSAFVDGGTLPAAFTCDGVGHSPPLAWSGAPAGTVGYALLMTTEAKDGLKWNWVLYNIPSSTTSLAEQTQGGGTAGKTSDGPQLAYAPPCSQGPGLKLYTFTVYALSGTPSFAEPADQVTGSVVSAAIAEMTLAQGALTVGYTRP